MTTQDTKTKPLSLINIYLPLLAQSFLRMIYSVFDFIYLKVVLARNFGAGQGSIKTPSRPAGIPHLCNSATLHLCNFVTLISKTNPKRTQTNPIFWRSNFNFSPKTRIFDKFRITFLCKTNPMVCYRYSNCGGV